jgi:hypothetical protein
MLIPDEMNSDLLDILGMPNFRAGPVAHAMQRAGEPIPQKAEAEQAHVIHKLLSIYAEHGENWRHEASKWLDGIIAAEKPSAA